MMLIIIYCLKLILNIIHQWSFTIIELKKNPSFSVLHCNVRSLSANHNSLMSLLSELDIIGISETKIKQMSDPISNFSIPNYSFLSQPTQSNAGSVGFFVSKNIEYHIRDEFNITNNDIVSTQNDF